MCFFLYVFFYMLFLYAFIIWFFYMLFFICSILKTKPMSFGFKFGSLLHLSYGFSTKWNSNWDQINRKSVIIQSIFILIYQDLGKILTHVISSTPSVFETVHFVFLKILTKSKACITHSLDLIWPNPNPNRYLPRLLS